MSQPPAVRQPIPVGKYFLERKKISEQQLDLALKHRAEFGLKLGQSLVELGFVTEADMVEALRHQARFPCIHLTRGLVSAHVANKLGEEVSRRLRVLGLNQIAGHTTVALEDPSDVQALEELAHILATRIFPVYAEPSAIMANLDLVFGPPKKARAVPKPAPIAPIAPIAPAAPAPAGTLLRRVVPQAGAKKNVLTLVGEPQARAQATESEAVPDERAVVERVRGFLQDAFAQNACDIHLEARRADTIIRFRVDGALREHSRLSSAWAGQTIACLKALAKIDPKSDEEQGAEPGAGHDEKHEVKPASEAGAQTTEGSIPFVFKDEQLELRVAITPSLHGESLVLHVVRNDPQRRSLRELGLGNEQLVQLEEALSARGGLFLVSGPSGSGRTTTLHALLAHLDAPHKKLIALEERVEREHEHVLHVKLDPHTSPAAGLRALLGQDPDVLLANEIDGRETAHVLFEAARSGRGVLSALRMSGAVETLTGLAHLGLEPYLLADTLRCVVAQRLVRCICPDCRAPIVPDEGLRTLLGFAKDGSAFFEGEGCEACHGSGYRGRIALFEVLRITPALRYELEKGGEGVALARAARADGFISLREHGLRHARAGQTTLHEVLAATPRA